MEALPRDEAFTAAIATIISNIATGNVHDVTADYLESPTLVALLKKSEEDTQALRDLLLGPSFVLPIHPLAMASVIVKLACNFTLSGIKDDIADVTGPN